MLLRFLPFAIAVVRREVPVVVLTTEQLHWILDGIDIDAMIRHPVRQYQVAG